MNVCMKVTYLMSFVQYDDPISAKQRIVDDFSQQHAVGGVFYHCMLVRAIFESDGVPDIAGALSNYMVAVVWMTTFIV